MEPGLMTVIPLVKVKMPLRLSLRHQSESRPSPHPVSHLTLWWAHSFIFKSQACLLIVLGAPFSFPENTGQNSLFAACLHACRPEASDALELELHVDLSFCGCTENYSCVLWRQQVPLTAEPSSSPMLSSEYILHVCLPGPLSTSDRGHGPFAYSLQPVLLIFTKQWIASTLWAAGWVKFLFSPR